MMAVSSRTQAIRRLHLEIRDLRLELALEDNKHRRYRIESRIVRLIEEMERYEQ